MIAQDALYHSDCLIKLYKKAQEISDAKDSDDHNNQIYGTAFAELVCYMIEGIDDRVNPHYKTEKETFGTF